jgi:hypothetical protein
MKKLNIKPIEGFDCMAFKRKVQAEIYQEIKGMTANEQIAYFRKEARASEIWRRFSKKPVAH